MAGKINVGAIKNFSSLCATVRTLFAIIYCAENGAVTLAQEDFAEQFNVKRQTAGKHLQELEFAGIINYKHGGKITLSTSFYDDAGVNVTAIKNFKLLSVGLKVLFVILACATPSCHIEFGKKPIARYLHIASQTVGNHLQTFVQADMLKYKYAGHIFINPDFFYTGDASELEAVKQDYKKFKSDI